MTERGGSYNHDGKPAKPPSEAQQLASRFVAAIANLHWRIDYVKFCELLDLEPSDYADQKYSQFQQLAEALNFFDEESLAKMVDAGEGKGGRHSANG